MRVELLASCVTGENECRFVIDLDSRIIRERRFSLPLMDKVDWLGLVLAAGRTVRHYKAIGLVLE
jgi:hypothetical protein